MFIYLLQPSVLNFVFYFMMQNKDRAALKKNDNNVLKSEKFPKIKDN